MAADWLKELESSEREGLSKAAFPEWLEAMKATLTDDHFSSPDWIFEPKLDGERTLVFVKGGRPKLLTRNRKALNNTYPELVEALSDLADRNMVVDGEIVAFEKGVSSFSRLQGRIGLTTPEDARNSDIPICLYLFDLLYYDGYDVRSLPLRTRKRLLKNALNYHDPVRYTPHRNEEGEAYFREACERGWEGVIAKRAGSAYRQSRSRDWLKFKCVNEQELVIAGYTDPEGERTGFGALLLGYYEYGELHYAGRVGTGFDEGMLEKLHGLLSRRTRKRTPFQRNQPEDSSGVHWVRPDLVCEVGFTEWTRDGKLRHPRFLGLRDDKSASDVRRERPE